MKNYFQYKLEIRRLSKRIKLLNNKFNKFESESNSTMEVHYASQDYHQEIFELETWIEHLQTERLRDICIKRALAMPKTTDKKYYYQYNFDDEFGDRNILTEEGFELVSKKIREEKQFRINTYSFYFTLISGIAGLIMGLIAFYKNLIN